MEEGVSYFSDSFHLLSKDGEVRWLDREDGHYVLSERIGPVPERLLSCVPKSKTTFNGRTYRFFDSGDSSVCSVQGQFTYGAKILDTSSYYDFVAPPHYLSGVDRPGNTEALQDGIRLPLISPLRFRCRLIRLLSHPQ